MWQIFECRMHPINCNQKKNHLINQIKGKVLKVPHPQGDESAPLIKI